MEKIILVLQKKDIYYDPHLKIKDIISVTLEQYKKLNPIGSLPQDLKIYTTTKKKYSKV